LGCHKSVAQECPEKSGDSTCMNGCKDDKRGGSLLEKRACRDKLEGESEKVEDEKCTKLDPTWSWVRRSKERRDGKQQDLPTAAFRRLQRVMSRRRTKILKEQARILAMLPIELSKPTRGIPHFGLTPTGADVVLAEAPIRKVGALC
jgi:hypothetical protein